MHAKLLQSFPTLWTVTHQAPLSMGILQARILEWVAMPSSRGSSQPRDQPKSLVSCALTGRFLTTSTTWGSPKSSSKLCQIVDLLPNLFWNPLTKCLPWHLTKVWLTNFDWSKFFSYDCRETSLVCVTLVFYIVSLASSCVFDIGEESPSSRRLWNYVFCHRW